jgi:hypothetical protein
LGAFTQNALHQTAAKNRACKGPKSESLMRHCRHRHAHPGKTPATDFGVFLGCISSLKIPILGEKWAIKSLKFVED